MPPAMDPYPEYTRWLRDDRLRRKRFWKYINIAVWVGLTLAIASLIFLSVYVLRGRQ
jgi:hypothetical protein